jgi:hypothetical protein
MIILAQEVGDSCWFDGQRVPVIDFRIPLKAMIS